MIGRNREREFWPVLLAIFSCLEIAMMLLYCTVLLAHEVIGSLYSIRDVAHGQLFWLERLARCFWPVLAASPCGEALRVRLFSMSDPLMFMLSY